MKLIIIYRFSNIVYMYIYFVSLINLKLQDFNFNIVKL